MWLNQKGASSSSWELTFCWNQLEQLSAEMLGRTIYLAVVFNLFLKFLLGKGNFVKNPQLQNSKLLETPKTKTIIHEHFVEKPDSFLIPGRSEYYPRW